MKFITAALFTAIATTPVTVVTATQLEVAQPRLQLYFDETPCTASAGLLVDLEVAASCTARTVEKAVQAVFGQVENECDWDFTYEMRLITRTLSEPKEDSVLDLLCEGANERMPSVIPQKTFEDIHEDLTPTFMKNYTEGGTFLNGA